MPDARRFGRVDAVILGGALLLGAALALATDQEYRNSHGRSPAMSGPSTVLPNWIKERRHDAIRTVHSTAALLSGLSLGLAVCIVRPRWGTRRRSGRLGPGHGAVLLASALVLAFSLYWVAVLWTLGSSMAASGALTEPSFLGIPLDLYPLWLMFRPQASWAILGAWSVVLVTGRWRQPVDAFDRLGRWLGWGWIALIGGQAVIYIIAWC